MIVRALFVAAPLAALLAAADREDPPSSGWLGLLPDGEQKRQFILNCTGCHQLDARTAFPGGAPRTRDSWLERIGSMHARFGPGTGFPIIADPIPDALLADYLVSHLGTAPAPVPARAPDPRVREYLLPAAGDLPHDLLVAADGRVVITGMFTHRMYLLDPASGEVTTEAIPVPGANPRAHHLDPDGTWWVVLGAPGMVAQRTPAGEWRTHAVGMYAHSIARDSSGVWVNGHFGGHPSVLAHVHERTGAITRTELPSATLPGTSPIPYELRTGPDGAVWMSELVGGRVLRYDPVTRQHRAYEMPVPLAGPRRLDVSRDGRVWIPLYAQGDLAELDPVSGAVTLHRLPDRDALPYVVRVDDARGAVWVATGASDAVYRFDRARRAFETIPLPSRGALVRHADVDPRTGDLWVAYGESPGKLAARVARVRSAPAAAGAGATN